MKDYSKFMESSESFILNYEVDGDEIKVNFANTDSKKPNIYKATKEKISEIEKRIEKQYWILINNYKEMTNVKNIQKNKKISKIAGLIGPVVGIIFAILTKTTVLAAMGIGISLVSFAACSIANLKIKKTEEKINTYKSYLENKDSLLQATKDDKNITRYLSESGQTKLQNQEGLVKSKKIDTPYNTNFMDKLSLKDLKLISERLKIYQSLQQEVKFKQELTLPEGKHLVKKPENK